VELPRGNPFDSGTCWLLEYAAGQFGKTEVEPFPQSESFPQSPVIFRRKLLRGRALYDERDRQIFSGTQM
jgi:hypothetical protein